MTQAHREHFFGTWADVIGPFTETEEFNRIFATLKAEKEAGKSILPDQAAIFRAFHETPLDKVRIIILGQDPYPAPQYANGLAFAINAGLPIANPASLNTIVDTIENECYGGIAGYDKNNFDVTLKSWTDQGIMLLNSALTVGSTPNNAGLEIPTAGTHMQLWRPFMNYLFDTLDLIARNKIVIACGQEAIEITKKMNFFKNFVITCEHPSRAAREKRPWKNESCFNRANAMIVVNDMGEKIKW